MHATQPDPQPDPWRGSPPGPQADLYAAVRSHLRERRSLTLATWGPEGPWAAAVYFAADGLSLYFLSDPASRHCRDLTADPRVAATVHEDVPSWQDIRGVQLSGQAEAISAEAEAARGWDSYLAKFPFVSGLRTADGFEIMGRPVIARLYRITPDRLFFLDNRAGFGGRQELDLTRGDWDGRSQSR
ncbi:MAG: pyridoxamine 5'-phosphate oxidase family protein [Frankiaceae bacterium]